MEKQARKEYRWEPQVTPAKPSLDDAPSRRQRGGGDHGARVYFFLLAAPLGLQDLISLTRDRTHALAVKAQNPNHWNCQGIPSGLPLS